MSYIFKIRVREFISISIESLYIFSTSHTGCSKVFRNYEFQRLDKNTVAKTENNKQPNMQTDHHKSGPFSKSMCLSWDG